MSAAFASMHWPARLFICCFALFIALQFIIAKDKLWDFFFYIAVLPSFGWLLARERRLLLPALHHRAVQIAAALLAWLCLSLSWQSGLAGDEGFHYVRHSLITGLFIVSACVFFRTAPPLLLSRFWHGLMLLAAICALISLARFLGGFMPQAVRLEAIGQLEQPILGAAVYGLIGVIALQQLLRRQPPQAWPFYALVLAMITALIFFTYSRGQLGAFSATAFVLLALYTGAKAQRILMLIVALLALPLALLILIPDLWQVISDALNLEMMLRHSYRLAIWEKALLAIEQKPLFGWGAASPFIAEFPAVTATHMHNLMLGTLYGGGLVAGVLLTALVATLAWRIRHMQPRHERLLCTAMLLYALLSVVTDNPSLVSSPAPFWTLFWLPICYIIAKTASQGDE